MLKSSSKVRPNSLCKPLTGHTFHRVVHDSWSKHCNLHWIQFITTVVNICGCHPHPNFTFSLGWFLGNHIKCYACECLYVYMVYMYVLYMFFQFIYWMHEMDVWWKFYGSKFELLIHPPSQNFTFPIVIPAIGIKALFSKREAL